MTTISRRFAAADRDRMQRAAEAVFSAQTVGEHQAHPSEEIDAKNGWLEHGELSDDQREWATMYALSVFREIMHFCFSSRSGLALRSSHTYKHVRVSYLKFFAFAQTVFPDLIVDENGKRMNQKQLAKALRMGKRGNVYLGILATLFSKQVALQFSSQKSRSSRDRCRDARNNFLRLASIASENVPTHPRVRKSTVRQKLSAVEATSPQNERANLKRGKNRT